jgi:hypothetical protein
MADGALAQRPGMLTSNPTFAADQEQLVQILYAPTNCRTNGPVLP